MADDLNTVFTRASELANSGQYGESARNYELCLRILGNRTDFPPDTMQQQFRTVAFHLAQVYDRLNRFHEAIELAEAGLSKSPTAYGQALGFVAKAEGLCGLGRAAEAKVIFDKAIQAHPVVGRLKSADSMTHLGSPALLDRATQLVAELLGPMSADIDDKSRAEAETIANRIAEKRRLSGRTQDDFNHAVTSGLASGSARADSQPQQEILPERAERMSNSREAEPALEKTRPEVVQAAKNTAVATEPDQPTIDEQRGTRRTLPAAVVHWWDLRQLRSRRPMSRCRAIQRLSKNTDSADIALIAGLAISDGVSEVRESALCALRIFGQPGADALAAQSKSTLDSSLLERGLSALMEIGVAGETALGELLAMSPTSTQIAILDILSANLLAAIGGKPGAVDAVVKHFGALAPNAKALAVRILHHAGDARAVPLIVEVLAQARPVGDSESRLYQEALLNMGDVGIDALVGLLGTVRYSDHLLTALSGKPGAVDAVFKHFGALTPNGKALALRILHHSGRVPNHTQLVPTILEHFHTLDSAGRRVALHMLCQAGDIRAIPWIVEALAQARPLGGSESCLYHETLLRMSDRALRPLLGLLTSLTGPTRAKAITLLSEIAGFRAVPNFSQYLNDEDDDVREAAVSALSAAGVIGLPDLIAALEGCVASDLRLKSALAISSVLTAATTLDQVPGNIGEVLVANIEKELWSPQLVDSLLSPLIRWPSLLPRNGLLRIIANTSARMRAQIVPHLSAFGVQGARALKVALRDEDRAVRRAALATIEVLLSKTVRNDLSTAALGEMAQMREGVLFNMCRDAHEECCRAAIGFLGWIEGSGASDSITAVLGLCDREVRRSIAGAVTVLGLDASAVVTQLFAEDDVDIRRHAVRSAGQILGQRNKGSDSREKLDSLINLLASAIRDRSVEVRQEAARAVKSGTASITSSDSFVDVLAEPLLGLFCDPVKTVAAESVSAIERILRSTDHAQRHWAEALCAFVDRAAYSGSLKLRQRALDLLLNLDSPCVAPSFPRTVSAYKLDLAAAIGVSANEIALAKSAFELSYYTIGEGSTEAQEAVFDSSYVRHLCEIKTDFTTRVLLRVLSEEHLASVRGSIRDVNGWHQNMQLARTELERRGFVFSYSDLPELMEPTEPEWRKKARAKGYNLSDPKWLP